MPKKSSNRARTKRPSEPKAPAKPDVSDLNLADPPRRAARPFLVVGVGASAGGMEAFSTVLRNLPADVPAAFVFICHLDPNHESSLDAIFQRETKLVVRSVHEPMPVKPGHIYVPAQPADSDAGRDVAPGAPPRQRRPIPAHRHFLPQPGR